MNGPGTGGLEIRHTPGTVPGGARPGWGLPFEQLPAATRRDLTPESTVSEQRQTGRKQIWDRFTLQWDELNRGARFIGRQKTQYMQQQLYAKAKQEILQFNQQAQQQMAQLQDIDRLAQQGMITNPDEIKARMTFGADVARQMFPTPAKEQTIPEQFGKLDVYSHRISQELERFQETKPPKPLGKLAGLSPLTAAISMYRSSRKPKRKVRIWDFTTGDWRKTLATPEEIAEYDTLRQEDKFIAQRKAELLGHPSIARRRTQPGTKGGTFSDKVAESVRPQQQVRRQPTATELRQRGTREAYEQGKTLGYWN